MSSTITVGLPAVTGGEQVIDEVLDMPAFDRARLDGTEHAYWNRSPSRQSRCVGSDGWA
ncbi:hypothetical protein [Burkholderia ubonensis]|uniref:hypothetical protein n=1 Tax=Burkholderia ubonensis TaxID=101571 RepID=UPI0012F787D0|nr:hypothetical protein [Burkholderia ubonensis]